MAKRDYRRPKVRTREEVPQIKREGGTIAFMCPFCQPSHPLAPGAVAQCGTVLKLTAMQGIIPARVARMEKIECLKCHNFGGGDMIPWHGGFVHLHDCDPDTKLLTNPPKFSKWAALRYHIPFLRGNAQAVKEITPDGKETGRVLGYTFYNG